MVRLGCTYLDTVNHLVAPFSRGRNGSAVNSTGKTALGNDLQSLITGSLDLIDIRDIDFEVVGAFGMRVGLDLGFTSLGGEYIKDLTSQLSPSLDQNVRLTTTLPPLSRMLRAVVPPIDPQPPVMMKAEG